MVEELCSDLRPFGAELLDQLNFHHLYHGCIIESTEIERLAFQNAHLELRL